jgi:hypothetical protein
LQERTHDHTITHKMKAKAPVQLGGVGGRSVPHKAKHDETAAGTYTYMSK